MINFKVDQSLPNFSTQGYRTSHGTLNVFAATTMSQTKLSEQALETANSVDLTLKIKMKDTRYDLLATTMR